MEKLLIFGGNKLNGKITIQSSKNAILPILAGSILTDENVTIFNVPNLTDIIKMTDILKIIGVKSEYVSNNLKLDLQNLENKDLPYELTKDIRASIFMLGSMLGKFKKVKIAYPGGCQIGSRPIDQHLKGLRALGVEILEEHGYIICDGKNMKPCEFTFDLQSVGATENLIMASVLLKGTTILHNVAREPEIEDLANFLNTMGAKISGAGTCNIKIKGVKQLHGTQYMPIGDRIVAGTILIGVVLTGGNVEICNINPYHIDALISKLNNNGCKIVVFNDKIKCMASGKFKAVPFTETKPFPDFPTDLQPQLMALLCSASGNSFVSEGIFENRMNHIPELLKMGAKIIKKNNIAIIEGVNSLCGAEVEATDLRAGACLVLAGLSANGYTKISKINYIDRGYDKIEEMFSKLGANIKRIVED